MDYLRRLLSLSRKRKRPAALSSSILNEIPVDILLYIMDFLPTESAVAFSISCMHLKCLLGAQHLERVVSIEDKLALLNLLALDLPNYVVCPACERLHNMQNLPRYNSATYNAGSTIYRYDSLRLPACVSRDRHKGTYAITGLFGTTAFRMAIKRYLQQPECTELLKIMSSKEVTTRERADYVRQYREECRVVQGNLMHRLQSVHIRVSPKYLTTTDFIRHPPSENICPHINVRKSEHNIGSGLKRCQKCHTEYRIDAKYYDGHGLAIFFTRWRNLGVDPEGELWSQHLPVGVAGLRELFTSRDGDQILVGLQTQPAAVPEEADIACTFEGNNEFKFDVLMTTENKFELFHFLKRCQA